MTPPRVTIILTTYDRPDLLREALESVFAQTLSEWQLIIVDDCGPEETQQAYEDAARDPRVKVIRHEHNVNNIAQSWNEGLDIADGHYVCTMDDDNPKLPRFLEAMCGALDAYPEAPAALSLMTNYDGGGVMWDVTPQALNILNIARGNIIDSNAVMYRREVFDEVGYFDEICKTAEDWNFVIRFLNNRPYGYLVIPEVLGRYRCHPRQRTYSLQTSMDTDRPSAIKAVRHPLTVSVSLTKPESERRTASQNDVINRIEETLKNLLLVPRVYTDADIALAATIPPEHNIPLIADLALVVMPMAINEEKLRKVMPGHYGTAMLMIEDPWAHFANKHAAYLLPTATVFTNERACVAGYKERKESEPEKRVNLVPTNPAPRFNFIPPHSARRFDLCMVGHPYPSRKHFMKWLLNTPGIEEFKLCLVGPEWSGSAQENVTAPGELPLDEAMRCLLSSHAALCLHRVIDDLPGCGTSRVLTPTRGFAEAAAGCLVITDDKRDPAEVRRHFNDSTITVRTPEEVVGTLRAMRDGVHDAKIAESTRLGQEFTYEKRLMRLLHCVLAHRDGATIR